MSGVACDDGPYDPEVATATWLADGEFSTDDTVYRGVGAIKEFFAGLSAAFTLHIFTNMELQACDGEGRTTVRCYGLEAPVLHDVAHFGAFAHLVVQDHPTGGRSFYRWQQKVHLITPALLGWVRGPKVANQTS